LNLYFWALLKIAKRIYIESNDSYPINTVIESRDGIFQENRFTSILNPKDIVHSNVQSLKSNVSNEDTLKSS